MRSSCNKGHRSSLKRCSDAGFGMEMYETVDRPFAEDRGNWPGTVTF